MDEDKRTQEASRLLSAALELHDAGLVVFPLTHPWDGVGGGKLPAIPNWQRYRLLAPSRADVESWFGGDEPHNIGVILGPISGLIVLDISSSTARRTAYDWSDLEIPNRTVLTGRGEHWYYQHPHGWGIRTSTIHDSGISICGTGSYVVGPYSRHESGQIYELRIEAGTAWQKISHISPKIVDILAARAVDNKLYNTPTLINGVELARETVLRRGAAVTRRSMLHPEDASNNDIMYAAEDLSGLGIPASAAALLLGVEEIALDIVYETAGLPLCERWIPDLPQVASITPDAPPKLETPDKISKNSFCLANVEIYPLDKKDEIRVAIPLSDIRGEVLGRLNGWPRTAGGHLFTVTVSDDNWDRKQLLNHDAVWWLAGHDHLFAWIYSVCDGVLWEAGRARVSINDESPRSLPSKKEFMHVMQVYPGTRYDGVEILPHVPARNNMLYLLPDMPTPKPGLPLWHEWCGMFNPETEEDAMMLQAAMLTPLWGGAPGTRPAFLLTSRHGRGVGKTATAEAMASLYGGAIFPTQLSGGPKDLPKALVSPEGMLKRCILWDNLKGKQDCAIIESMITAESIQGHKLYSGHAVRPNLLTWYVTANKPEVSTDLAQRCIPIEIGTAKHTVDFGMLCRDFLAANRLELLSEMCSILDNNNQPSWSLSTAAADRWQAWTRAVFTKIPHGYRCLPLIDIRRRKIDVDKETADYLVDSLVALIRRKCKISQAVATGNFSFSTLDLHEQLRIDNAVEVGSAVATGRLLNKMIKDGDVANLRTTRLRIAGISTRGFAYEPGIETMKKLLAVPVPVKQEPNAPNP